MQEKQWQLTVQPDGATYVSTYLFKGQIRRWTFLKSQSIVSNANMATLATIIEQNQSLLLNEVLPFPSDLQEAYFAKTYFRLLNQLLPKPFQFQKRSRRPALDAFNALLNYALGWLYAIVNNAVRRAKLDPYIGFHHRPNDNTPVLVFDLIEAYRAWIEMVCIQMIQDRIITLKDFETAPNANGGMVIKKMARRKIIQQVHLSFQETINGTSKIDSIYEDARAFARFIRHYDVLKP